MQELLLKEDEGAPIISKKYNLEEEKKDPNKMLFSNDHDNEQN